MIIGLLILLGVLSVIGAAAYSLRRKRLPGKVQPWGVRYNPDCIYSSEQISQVITAFVDVWTQHYPTDRPALVDALRDLDIQWHQSRVVYQLNGTTSEVMAVMESPKQIHLWVGPKLRNGQRNIVFTGLLDQLCKLALLVNNRPVDTNDPAIRKVWASVRQRLP